MRKKQIAFTVIFVAILFQLYIDLYLPGLIIIAKYYHASSAQMDLSISLYMFGCAICFLPIGIFSDSLGRKKIMILGLLILIIGTLLSVFATNIDVFLIGRFVQGAGTAVYVLASPILIDIFDGNELISAFTYYNIAYSVIPLVGPYIGGIIFSYLNWHLSFEFLFCVSLISLIMVIFFLEETLSKPIKSKSKREIISNLKNTFLNRQYIFLTILCAIIWGDIICFYNIGPFLFQKTYNLSPYFFGIISVIIGGCYLISCILNKKALKKFSPSIIMKTAIVCIFVISIMFLISSVSNINNTYATLIFIMLTALSIGFIFINAMTISLAMFKENAGLASSLQATIWVVIWGSISLIVSCFSLTQLTLAFSFVILGLVAVLIWFIFLRTLVLPEKITAEF